ncbi:hypothetical protein ACEPAI_5722 [Sanghuangporus weigelae]
MYRLASRQILRSSFLPLRRSALLLRTFSTTQSRLSNGEPTKLHNILGDGPAPPVQVRKITAGGIELEDGLILPSASIFLDGDVFLWNVPINLWDGWTKEQFEVFEAAIPKPGVYCGPYILCKRMAKASSLLEILILGTGKNVSHPPPSIRMYLNSIGIQLDVMDTWNACTTYNLLSEEGRRVAAALLPTTPRTWKK